MGFPGVSTVRLRKLNSSAKCTSRGNVSSRREEFPPNRLARSIVWSPPREGREPVGRDYYRRAHWRAV